MKFNKNLLAAAVMALAGATQASAETVALTQGGYQESHGRGFDDLGGSAGLNFSKQAITIWNLMRASIQEVPDAELQVATLTNASGQVRYVSVQTAAPITELTGDFDGATFTVSQVGSQGGVQLRTVKQGATNGIGSLSISDLRADLSTKTVYADIVGANGVGTLNDYALWTYDTISAPATFRLDPTNKSEVTLSSSFLLSGLFLVKSTDIDDVFVRALNLNSTGRSGMRSVNTRPDASAAVSSPTGFGTLSLTVSVTAVPEPSAYALMGVGLVGLALFGRRRAGR